MKFIFITEGLDTLGFSEFGVNFFCTTNYGFLQLIFIIYSLVNIASFVFVSLGLGHAEGGHEIQRNLSERLDEDLARFRRRYNMSIVSSFVIRQE